MNWRWWEKKKKPVQWEITSQDVKYNGFEASTTVQGGWEPFGVTYVPNLPPDSGMYLRLWVRRLADAKKAKARVIKIQSAGWGGHEVLLHLTGFWTPISVAASPGAPDQAIIWFIKEEGGD